MSVRSRFTTETPSAVVPVPTLSRYGLIAPRKVLSVAGRDVSPTKLRRSAPARMYSCVRASKGGAGIEKVPAVVPVAVSRSVKVIVAFVGAVNTDGTAILIVSGDDSKNSFTRQVPALVFVAVSRTTLPEAIASTQRSPALNSRSVPVTGISRRPLTP